MLDGQLNAVSTMVENRERFLRSVYTTAWFQLLFFAIEASVFVYISQMPDIPKSSTVWIIAAVVPSLAIAVGALWLTTFCRWRKEKPVVLLLAVTVALSTPAALLVVTVHAVTAMVALIITLLVAMGITIAMYQVDVRLAPWASYLLVAQATLLVVYVPAILAGSPTLRLCACAVGFIGFSLAILEAALLVKTVFPSDELVRAVVCTFIALMALYLNALVAGQTLNRLHA
ncbi:Inhibitor of apoptosis-promoting Bax1 [Plasmodiophora brassicae]